MKLCHNESAESFQPLSMKLLSQINDTAVLAALQRLSNDNSNSAGKQYQARLAAVLTDVSCFVGVWILLNVISDIHTFLLCKGWLRLRSNHNKSLSFEVLRLRAVKAVLKPLVEGVNCGSFRLIFTLVGYLSSYHEKAMKAL